MTAADLLQRVRAAGVHLSIEAGRIVASPRAAITEELRTLIRANKAALLEALSATETPLAATSATPTTRRPGHVAHVADVALVQQGRHEAPSAAGGTLPGKDDAPDNAPGFEARRQRVLAMLADRQVRYALLVDGDAEPEAVILALAIRSGAGGGAVTCELRVPREKFDPYLLLDLVARHGATVH